MQAGAELSRWLGRPMEKRLELILELSEDVYRKTVHGPQSDCETEQRPKRNFRQGRIHGGFWAHYPEREHDK